MASQEWPDLCLHGSVRRAAHLHHLLEQAVAILEVVSLSHEFAHPACQLLYLPFQLLGLCLSQLLCLNCALKQRFVKALHCHMQINCADRSTKCKPHTPSCVLCISFALSWISPGGLGASSGPLEEPHARGMRRCDAFRNLQTDSSSLGTTYNIVRELRSYSKAARRAYPGLLPPQACSFDLRSQVYATHDQVCQSWAPESGQRKGQVADSPGPWALHIPRPCSVLGMRASA